MYKINSTRIEQETFFTNVTYTLTDGTEVEVDVAVFAPENKDAVIKAIEDRAKTEQIKYDSEKVNLTIKSELDKTIGKAV